MDPGLVSRRQAAQLLKLARHGSGDVVSEAVDWAYAAMPDRVIVQRLKVRSLLRTGQFESADALLAQALLIYPTDHVLSTMRAERLLHKGRLESAAREIELVLAHHPERPSALSLGAEIASRQGDRARALALLQRAVDARPFEAPRRIQLIEALLADEQTVQAVHHLAYLSDPPALLEARVMHAQGCTIDALARLQREWNTSMESDHADHVAAAIVSLLEEIGRLDELERFVNEFDTSHPRAIAKAAESWLMLGRFEEAAQLGAMLLKRRAFVPIGRGVLLVASTMRGNFGLAQRVVRQLVTSELTIDRISLAELWRRGTIGRLVRNGTSLTSAQAHASQGVLSTMAQSACELFREQLAEAEAESDTAAMAELMHFVRLCTLKPRAERAPRAEQITMPALPEQKVATPAEAGRIAGRRAA